MKSKFCFVYVYNGLSISPKQPDFHSLIFAEPTFLSWLKICIYLGENSIQFYPKQDLARPLELKMEDGWYLAQSCSCWSLGGTFSICGPSSGGRKEVINEFPLKHEAGKVVLMLPYRASLRPLPLANYWPPPLHFSKSTSVIQTSR